MDPPSPQQLMEALFFLHLMPCPVTLHSMVGTQQLQQSWRERGRERGRGRGRERGREREKERERERDKERL